MFVVVTSLVPALTEGVYYFTQVSNVLSIGFRVYFGCYPEEIRLTTGRPHICRVGGWRWITSNRVFAKTPEAGAYNSWSEWYCERETL